jgi:GNAT superfamily N-acetyltransferase
MEIRAATPDDGPAIAVVHKATWAATYSQWIPDVVAGYDLHESGRNWAESAKRPDGRVAVAVDGDRVVGFAGSGPAHADSLDESDDPGAVGEVYAIYVDPAYHGRGLGRRLMADALEWLAADGRAQCVLWVVAPSTRSLQFYERVGFTHDEGAHQDWRGLDVVRYRRAVSAPRLPAPSP